MEIPLKWSGSAKNHGVIDAVLRALVCVTGLAAIISLSSLQNKAKCFPFGHTMILCVSTHCGMLLQHHHWHFISFSTEEDRWKLRKAAVSFCNARYRKLLYHAKFIIRRLRVYGDVRDCFLKL
ncbi:hypothetical protein Tco_1045136 [Tanacetum coccineum]|uniref:CASP-like protein n=1 Tax=Tanacetum coccineum TaxID=301880 RepID=A0ABQ5GRW5_9ASTR